MKHISQTPEAPSAQRQEIPRDLDLVVLRALAKEPADRYRSAQEMDRDLELVARGESVARETEEAATVVLAGATAVTEIGGVDAEALDGRVRRRRALPRLRRAGLARPRRLAVAARSRAP